MPSGAIIIILVIVKIGGRLSSGSKVAAFFLYST